MGMPEGIKASQAISDHQASRQARKPSPCPCRGHEQGVGRAHGSSLRHLPAPALSLPCRCRARQHKPKQPPTRPQTAHAPHSVLGDPNRAPRQLPLSLPSFPSHTLSLEPLPPWTHKEPYGREQQLVSHHSATTSFSPPGPAGPDRGCQQRGEANHRRPRHRPCSRRVHPVQASRLHPAGAPALPRPASACRVAYCQTNGGLSI
jgi:hypothetical protein